IVDSLKVKLLVEAKTVAARRYTYNPEAYQAYLKGRFYMHQFTTQGWKQGIEYFEQTTRMEQDYAPAYAGAALCWNGLWYYGILPPHEIVPKWREATNRALQIDSDLAEAHLSLANVQFAYEWNWDAAERDYRRAIELNPNSADARWFFGTFLSSRGRHAEAIAQANCALELDPLSPLVNSQVGWTYWLASDLDRTLAQARRLLEIEPRAFGGYWLKAAVQLARRLYSEAIDSYQ